MNSRIDNFWYSLMHPLGPSRELGTYANHQESAEQLIREMNARVLPTGSRLAPRAIVPTPQASEAAAANS
jgi:hypothetical protein